MGPSEGAGVAVCWWNACVGCGLLSRSRLGACPVFGRCSCLMVAARFRVVGLSVRKGKTEEKDDVRYWRAWQTLVCGIPKPLKVETVKGLK